MTNASAIKPLNQIAFVVADLNAAIAYWTEVMGVGPFFVFPKFPAEGGDYRGAEMISDYGAAVAYSGDLMVELIEPRGPSIFQEFHDRGGKGVQHLCAFADDMASAQRALEARGGKRIQGLRFTGGSEVAYFAMTEDESLILEIAVLAPEYLAIFEAIKAAGATWDGETKTLTF